MRSHQLSNVLYRSPIKKNKVKANTYVHIPGQRERKLQLEKKLEALLQRVGGSSSSSTADTTPALQMPDNHEDTRMDVENSPVAQDTSVDMEASCQGDFDTSPSVQAPPSEHLPVNVESGAKLDAKKLDSRWKGLLPGLLEPLLAYRNRTTGRFDHHFEEIEQLYYREINVPYCKCRDLHQTLVEHGFFPASPSQPWVAFKIVLLDLYCALCEKSSNAVHALAGALDRGEALQDPIQRGLGQVVQWYDCLLVLDERRLESIVQGCRRSIPTTVSTPLPTDPPASAPSTSLPTTTAEPSSTINAAEKLPAMLAPGECTSLLQQLCPACFGGREFGRSFNEGGDIHVALDGNLYRRHLKLAGKGIPFHTSQRFLSKDFVNAVGDRIEQARSKPAKARMPKVPDEAIDACTESYQAARGDGEKKRTQDVYDENGLMALVCRHDIPIFVASINTPGEQQRYSVALLEALFTMIPKGATVVGLYDIGCVLDRSLSTYDLLPEQYMARLQLATSMMHTYGHQWTCQLTFNPRLRKGLGLTDGEGTERLWSRLRGLIGIEHHSSLDCIARDLRDSLGTWQHHRLHNNIHKKEIEASQTFASDGIPMDVLQEQWRLQHEAQMSVRAHAPSRLKKQLNKVFQLQSKIEAVEAISRI
ncbi:hypothetical protein E1B28_000365 [Marasmius oreades]|uniref:CxC1-like cysteine cluster associated with KDZ transposases domain-containing protein n=1 Tax=Marasmius oreades TaxID=181124 RepID=A0A9P7V132_9AGAR|nr:uncharacterized protein E1B28_000365 [Marasmius oreades]KAG7098406.1 hypothetical protein E1B28_000365 [Marasmius oreades]